MKFNNNISNSITGKKGEYEIITKLMSAGFMVYTPVLDIDGVDCIIKNELGRLIEIQIKTRIKGDGYNKDFVIKRELNPHKDFFICCYLINTNENSNDVWFIPSFKFQKLAKRENGHTILTMNLENEKELLGYKDDRGLRVLKDIFIPKNETQTS